MEYPVRFLAKIQGSRRDAILQSYSQGQSHTKITRRSLRERRSKCVPHEAASLVPENQDGDVRGPNISTEAGAESFRFIRRTNHHQRPIVDDRRSLDHQPRDVPRPAGQPIPTKVPKVCGISLVSLLTGGTEKRIGGRGEPEPINDFSGSKDVRIHLQGKSVLTLVDSTLIGRMDKEESKEIFPVAANLTEEMVYQFQVMPFGLKEAPKIFQRLITQEVFTRCIRVFGAVILFWPDYNCHLWHLALVLEGLRLHGLKCDPSKCTLGINGLEYLGCPVYAAGNGSQGIYVRKIAAAIVPTIPTQLQSFIGVGNWLRH